MQIIKDYMTTKQRMKKLGFRHIKKRIPIQAQVVLKNIIKSTEVVDY